MFVSKLLLSWYCLAFKPKTAENVYHKTYSGLVETNGKGEKMHIHVIYIINECLTPWLFACETKNWLI